VCYELIRIFVFSVFVICNRCLFFFLLVVFLFLILILFILLFGVVGILEHGFNVTTNEGHEDGSSQTCRDEVEQRRLCVLVPVHDADGEGQSGDVCDEGGVEVEVRVAIQFR